MKSISTPAIIEGLRARKDGSLGLSVSTPEMSPQEKALFFELQNINLDIVITPKDEPNPEEYKIESGDLNTKSPSQRMRSVLFILWKQDNEGLEFLEYYRRHMEKLIEFLKSKIKE